jgi:hypothetical protein
VVENDIVVGRMLDGNQYALIHQPADPWDSWNSSQMLSEAMTNATA